MVENKYDRFFESVKEFCVKNTSMAYPEDIKGLSEVKYREIRTKI